jgi:sulfur carrier protein
MQIKLNGEIKQIDNDITVKQLADSLNIDINSIVVELNRDILDRETSGNVILKAEDEIEFISFFCGG